MTLPSQVKSPTGVICYDTSIELMLPLRFHSVKTYSMFLEKFSIPMAPKGTTYCSNIQKTGKYSEICLLNVFLILKCLQFHTSRYNCNHCILLKFSSKISPHQKHLFKTTLLRGKLT